MNNYSSDPFITAYSYFDEEFFPERIKLFEELIQSYKSELNSSHKVKINMARNINGLMREVQTLNTKIKEMDKINSELIESIENKKTSKTKTSKKDKKKTRRSTRIKKTKRSTPY